MAFHVFQAKFADGYDNLLTKRLGRGRGCIKKRNRSILCALSVILSLDKVLFALLIKQSVGMQDIHPSAAVRP
jgi:hypothetical protein